MESEGSQDRDLFFVIGSCTGKKREKRVTKGAGVGGTNKVARTRGNCTRASATSP